MGSAEDEGFLDVLRDFPKGLEAGGEVSNASRNEKVPVLPVMDAHLTFEDVDNLVRTEDPRECAGRAVPEPDRQKRIRRGRKRHRTRHRCPLLDPARLDGLKLEIVR